MVRKSTPRRRQRSPRDVGRHPAVPRAGEVGYAGVVPTSARTPGRWRSPVFGADKTAGTMDPLQRAADAGDLHEWEMSLP
ncbi:MAG TPA: hypothetical protein VIV12_23300 [Streptosporangiaceae bacterium]